MNVTGIASIVCITHQKDTEYVRTARIIQKERCARDVYQRFMLILLGILTVPMPVLVSVFVVGLFKW